MANGTSNNTVRWVSIGLTLFLAFGSLAYFQGDSASRLTAVERKVERIAHIERIVIRIAERLDIMDDRHKRDAEP
jgi:hypothetical protein